MSLQPLHYEQGSLSDRAPCLQSAGGHAPQTRPRGQPGGLPDLQALPATYSGQRARPKPVSGRFLLKLGRPVSAKRRATGPALSGKRARNRSGTMGAMGNGPRRAVCEFGSPLPGRGIAALPSRSQNIRCEAPVHVEEHGRRVLTWATKDVTRGAK